MRELIRQKASELGFCVVGISKADFLEQEACRLDAWLGDSLHADMAYMKNHFDLRTDPRKLVADAKSVISVACNYFSPEIQPAGVYKISRYAYGRDYHKVIREKLLCLFDFIRTVESAARGRCHHRRKTRPFSTEKIRSEVEKDTIILLAAIEMLSSG